MDLDYSKDLQNLIYSPKASLNDAELEQRVEQSAAAQDTLLVVSTKDVVVSEFKPTAIWDIYELFNIERKLEAPTGPAAWIMRKFGYDPAKKKVREKYSTSSINQLFETYLSALKEDSMSEEKVTQAKSVLNSAKNILMRRAWELSLYNRWYDDESIDKKTLQIGSSNSNLVKIMGQEFDNNSPVFLKRVKDAMADVGALYKKRGGRFGKSVFWTALTVGTVPFGPAIKLMIFGNDPAFTKDYSQMVCDAFDALKPDSLDNSEIAGHLVGVGAGAYLACRFWSFILSQDWSSPTTLIASAALLGLAYFGGQVGNLVNISYQKEAENKRKAKSVIKMIEELPPVQE